MRRPTPTCQLSEAEIRRRRGRSGCRVMTGRHAWLVNRNDAMAAAVSASWEDRASAARRLAESLDDQTRDLLDQLLTDQDVAVAQAAAAALLMRGDALAVAVFARAYVRADDQLGDSFNDVLRGRAGESRSNSDVGQVVTVG